MSGNGQLPHEGIRARRINHGRGHSYELELERVPGITTALNGGYPKPALIEWAGKATAKFTLDHWDELAELPPSERLDRMLRARFEARDTAAVRGTAVHSIAQRLAAGEELDVPEELLGHVDAYLKFVHDWKPEELYVERPVFSAQWKYAGTPDLFARLVDGRLWLLDWKTSEKGIFLDHVLQLAAARYADFLLDENDQVVPVPQVDAAGCVNLRADGYDLVPVEANAKAHRVFLYVLQVARYAESLREDWIGDALPPIVEARE